MMEMLVEGYAPARYEPLKYDPTIKYGIVRHRPRDVGLPFAPDTIPMQDLAGGDGKGHTIPVMPSWWSYLQKINNAAGYAYTRTIGAMWINIPYDQEAPDPNPPAQAESITCGGNFVAWRDETISSVKLLCYNYQMDTTVLNPLLHNWEKQPYLFFKAIAISPDGKLINPGNDIDAYFALIAFTELWMQKIDLEIFPTGYNYRFNGCNVYDGTQPLMLVGTDRSRVFPTSWHIDTVGVIPPI